MQLVQVENGQIIKYTLPKVGQLKDGRTVSGYDTLMKSNLELAKEEGWLPLVDNKPEYNRETQYLQLDKYDILEDEVVIKYTVKNIEVDIPILQEVTLDDFILDMDFRLSLIELNI